MRSISLYIKRTLVVIHCIMAALLLLHWILKYFTVYTIRIDLMFPIIVTLGISGVALFFWFIKPLRYWLFYFSYFVFCCALVLLTYFSQSALLGLVLYFSVRPLVLDEVLISREGISLVSVEGGFMMNSRFTYQVLERKNILIDKCVKVFTLDERIDYKTISIEVSDTEKVISFSYPKTNDEKKWEKIIVKQ